MGNFKELNVWKLAKELSISVYKTIDQCELKKDYALKDQMWRSAVSVPSNIAEGDELDTVRQGLKHFHYAKGSLAELETQLIIAHEVGYINEKKFTELEIKIRTLSIKLKNFISFRAKQLTPKKT